jgi:serine/threonine-protein kinase
MDKNIGKRLDGRYEVTELIGVGGMADVYKAIDMVDNKTVAVKILKQEFSDNEEFIRRFRNESKAIAVLSHPNIVKVFDVGFTDKLQFIVMEYIDGITLKEFIEQQGVLKWKDTVHFVIQVLRALQHAHDRGIVHRDIKPQNIMLFPDGTIKVMDFGIARFAREDLKTTISDKAIGSVHYISPEQASGNVTDERSDIYSVGIMMYEMLTGVKPFDADNPLTVVLMHMQKGAKPPRLINDSIPEGLEEIVMRAMQADPAKRYQSASEMIKDIEEFKRNPAINFAYSYTDTQTMNFDLPGKTAVSKAYSETKEPEKRPVSNTRAKTKAAVVYDYDDEEEDEGVSKSSYFVVILTAIAAAIVVIVVAFIAIQMADIFQPGETETLTMPDLIGLSYVQVKTSYSASFDLVNQGEEYSDQYPEGAIIRQSIEADQQYKVGAKQYVTVSRGKRKVIIDNVYGQTAAMAESILKANGDFQVQYIKQNDDNVEIDMVIKTDPPHNTEVDAGSLVLLYVSLGPAETEIIVPNVVGQPLETASQLLSKFNVTIVMVDSLQTPNTVIEQSIKPTDENGAPVVVRIRQPIEIKVSTGKQPAVEVPITFAVPNNIPKSASATFKSYINGNFNSEVSVDNIKYASSITVPVSGNGIQMVTIEAINNDRGKKVDIAHYEVNFDYGTYAEIDFYPGAFLSLFEGDASAAYTNAPSTSPPSYYTDPFSSNDTFWESILGR